MPKGGNWFLQEALGHEYFEWDEVKRQANLSKHSIDFVDAAKALLDSHLVRVSARHGEHRCVAVAMHQGRNITVIYALRERVCRIISARTARRNERKAYQAFLN